MIVEAGSDQVQRTPGGGSRKTRINLRNQRRRPIQVFLGLAALSLVRPGFPGNVGDSFRGNSRLTCSEGTV